jgi:hypothetical protein
VRRLGLFAAFACLAGCRNPPPETPLTLDDTSLQAGFKDDQDLEKLPFTDEEKTQSRGKLGGVWVTCYRTFLPTGEPSADLARLTAACGRPTGLVPLTPVKLGEPQTHEDPVERFTWKGRGGRCYRVFAIGAAEVTDLDLTILDESGRPAASDLSHDRWPVVPARGPLCLERDGVLGLVVAVANGKGSYVLQILSDGPAEAPK